MSNVEEILGKAGAGCPLEVGAARDDTETIETILRKLRHIAVRLVQAYPDPAVALAHVIVPYKLEMLGWRFPRFESRDINTLPGAIILPVVIGANQAAADNFS